MKYNIDMNLRKLQEIVKDTVACVLQSMGLQSWTWLVTDQQQQYIYVSLPWILTEFQKLYDFLSDGGGRSTSHGAPKSIGIFWVIGVSFVLMMQLLEGSCMVTWNTKHD